MKTALLVVSFGTTHLDTFEKTIIPTECAIAAAFPQYPMYRAFVSNIVRRHLREERGMFVDDVEQALARIAEDGYTHVLLQPTLLIPGEEMDRLMASAMKGKGSLQVSVGMPLLCQDEDLEEILNVLEQVYPVESDTVLLVMGHGTEHSGNRIYEQLVEKMRKRNSMAMRLCTVESSPSFEDAVQELLDMTHRKVVAAPLLFVAGDHAKNDMASKEEDSLRSLLEVQGFAVDCRLQGLGEFAQIHQMFVDKARKAKEE